MLQIFLYPVLILLIFSVISGPLGVFMIWKRISYFADALAHASILGAAASFLTNINPWFGAFFISTFFAVTSYFIRDKFNIKSDVAISLTSSFFVALALILLKFSNNNFHTIESFLFGDILLVSKEDVLSMALTFALAVTWIIFRWKDIFKIIISEDIAISEGINVKKINLEVLVVMSLFVANSMKIMGIMLLTSSMILPAVIAIKLFSNPIKVLFGSTAAGTIISIISFIIAFNFDQSISTISVMTGFIILIVVCCVGLYTKQLK